MLPAFDVVVESPVIAEIVNDSELYRDRMLRVAVHSVEAGQLVEILEDYSAVVYRVAAGDVVGWVAAKDLRIPEESPRDNSLVAAKQLEDFVNRQAYESPTGHLILVDIARQRLYIFEGTKGGWGLAQSFECSTGLNTSPTTRGHFFLADRGEWFYSYRLESGAKYWIRFNGNYLFHTIPMDKNKNIIPGEGVVGVRLSNGCVRLLVDDMRWIYENIPDATAVIIL